MVQVKEEGLPKPFFPKEIPGIVGHHHDERKKNGPRTMQLGSQKQGHLLDGCGHVVSLRCIDHDGDFSPPFIPAMTALRIHPS